MADDIQAVEAKRRQLTADIAHELRTPLTNIHGYLEAMNDRVISLDTKTIDTVHKEAVHLSALVDDLRLLAMADGGALALETAPDRIDKLTESVVLAFVHRAQEMDVEIKCFFDQPLPLVNIDRTRMAQIIRNLLANALHHSKPQGEINVRIDYPHSSPSVYLSGEGIAREDLDRIFERFYRTDTSRSQSTGGLGLGLTIVKRLVEAHGGAISVESVIGQGTKFVAQFPRSEATAD